MSVLPSKADIETPSRDVRFVARSGHSHCRKSAFIRSPRRLWRAAPGLRWLGRDYSRDLRTAEWGPTVILRGNNPQDRMSALGQKQTSRHLQPMSALPPKADIAEHARNVRVVPKADIRRLIRSPRRRRRQATCRVLQLRHCNNADAAHKTVQAGRSRCTSPIAILLPNGLTAEIFSPTPAAYSPPVRLPCLAFVLRLRRTPST